MFTIALGIILVPVLIIAFYFLAIVFLHFYISIKRYFMLKKGFHYYKCEKLGSMGGIYTDYIWTKEEPKKGDWYDIVTMIY